MLSLNKLNLSYGEEAKILKDITLHIFDGECVLLTGESGSGKSSIINAVNGLAREYENATISGSIRVDEKDVQEMKLYEISLLIASVFQNPKTHFFNVNTTLELLFYLENIGLSREEMKERMEQMLEVFPISHLLGRSIFELSGGEKQILCVASAFISGCDIIVLDEPSSNLDEYYIDILREMLQILKGHGITLLIAEHRLYYLMDIADRIVLLKDGMIHRDFSKPDFQEITTMQRREWGFRSRQKPKLKKSGDFSKGELRIASLCCAFKEHGMLQIEDLLFSFGKIYGIIGKNGVGKSTFLRAMTGLEEKGKCHIEYQGRKLGKRERLKMSALVMQDVNHQLFTDSVEEELKLGVTNPKPEHIQAILFGLGLEKFKERHPMSLSGGQKQRVAIASVLAKDSECIYFDEPTSGMDYENMMKISNLIKSMMTDYRILFIVSHDIEFLNATADYVLCLEEYWRV